MQKNVLKIGFRIVFWGLLGMTGIISCRKEKSIPTNIDTTGGIALSDEDSLKYYIYHYMQVTLFDGPDTAIYPKIPLYLWYKQVPSLNPLSPDYDSAEDLLTDIISYPKNPDNNNSQIDRYSFLDRESTVSGEIEGGQSGDLGFWPGYALDQDNKLHLVVLYVYPNSDAGQKGVKRGWDITAINGNTDISDVDMVNDALFGSGATFTFSHDSTSTQLALTPSSYTLTPVLYDTIYDFNGKKTGYFVFNQFVDVYNYTYDSLGNVIAISPTETKAELDDVFNKFKSAGVSNVIIDLRYNGGGSTNTAEYIDSLYAPSSAANKLMYSVTYNDKLNQYKTDLELDDKINFGIATGGLQLDHIFFITTRNTVSASELTLNNLKPYMDVKLVGDTTYGKPVGFFTKEIYDHDAAGQLQHLADLYDINFQTSNARGEGDYFLGIPPDQYVGEVVGYDWGDQDDPMLAAIKNYITTGSFRVAAQARQASGSSKALRRVRSSLKRNKFDGMVNFKSGKKLQSVLWQRMIKKNF